MSLHNALFYTIDPEILKRNWEDFSKQINGEFSFNESIRANVNGPIYSYKILSQLEGFDLNIKQTVYINPGSNDHPTAQEYILSKESIRNIYFRIWKKDFIEKIFGVNKTNTGIQEIDEKFSLKTNHKKLEELFKKNEKLREVLTSNDYHFFVETRKRTLRIILKRIGIVKSIGEFERDFEFLNFILEYL